MTNPLQQQLLRMIAATGPISIAEYMHLCHSHHEHGYYATGSPVGKTGDFITAPEISQMFGELICIWSIGVWHATGKPVPFQIAELGPGRGTLMSDFLRASNCDRDFAAAIKVKFIETSPSLEKEQRAVLADYSNEIDWCGSVDELEPIPTLFIGNEFLDAIPFRQFVKVEEQWLELCIGIDENRDLAFTPGSLAVDAGLLPKSHDMESDGAIFESAPAREAIAISVAAHIKMHGGAALFIDYGHDKSGFGDTFQAVQSHRQISPLADPGNSDLTSHVDFEAIGDAAKGEGARVLPLETQGNFLIELGLLERAGELGRGKSPAVQAGIQADVERLVSPDQMGDLFKIMCFTDRACDFPGFGKSEKNY